MMAKINSPGTKGGLGGRQRTLSVKRKNMFKNQLFSQNNKNYPQKIFSQKWVKSKRRIANATSGCARKPPGPKTYIG